MPFDYDEYQKKCNNLTTEQLHKEWENYTRQISGGATSTATSVLFSPLTGGISLMGLGLSAPRIHNARKKREIIEVGLQARGATHITRKRDVIAPMAVAGTLGGLTLGLAGPGADMLAGAAVGHGVEYAITHAALDGARAALEHSHDEHSKKKADEKLGLQYQNFQQQLTQQGTIQHQQVLVQPMVQPSFQTFPSASHVSSPGTPQLAPANLPNVLYGTNSQIPVALAVPPPIPLYSRPGTPQQVQPQLYQPAVPNQDRSYANVPVPPPYGSSYEPASHQQQYTQQQLLTQSQAPGTIPLYQQPQQPENQLVAITTQIDAEANPPEKTAAFTTSPHTASFVRPPHQTPLPQYSGSKQESTLPNNVQELPAQSTSSSHLHPEHIDLPPAPPTIEEEILLLKARLIQLELEKREVQPVQQVSIASNHQRQESQPSLILTPPSVVPTQEQTQYSSPPKSPALPPRSPVIVSQQQVPPPQAQEYFPPPPSSSLRPQLQLHASAPEMSFTYNPQSYPQQPPLPNCQQPQYPRHDSGYYSTASTPAASNSISQSFMPVQTGYSISPQSTGHHGYSPSLGSFNQPSPMSPAPPPYFPPPPGTATGPGKECFANGAPPISPNAGGNQRQSVHGMQGWPWGTAPAVAVGEPNYAPVPVPTPWRG